MSKVCKKGSIAYCGYGCIGLIMEDEPQEVTYSDGTKGVAYVGIHITDNKYAKFGDPWSSRNPRVICQAGDLDLWTTLVDKSWRYDELCK